MRSPEAEEVEKLRENFRQFTYIVSHDLSSPMRTAVAFSKLLQEHCHGMLDERGMHYLSFIVSSGERAQAMLAGLLQYSRLNTVPGKPVQVNLRRIVDECLMEHESITKQLNAKIQVGDLPTINADHEQMKQLFSALISNALKFHKTGAAPQVNISAEKSGNLWKFTIQDRGIGIDHKFHEEIFNVFRRLHREDEYPGIGIGLPVAKKIVELHGGTIGVESMPGEESIFTFTL